MSVTARNGVSVAADAMRADADASRSPLLDHAFFEAVPAARAAVLRFVGLGGPATFGEVAAAVGSTVAARYAVLQLAAEGDVVILTDGHLGRGSVLAGRARHVAAPVARGAG